MADPWVQSFAVVALAAVGVCVACAFSRCRYWFILCASALLILCLFGAARWQPRLELVAPFRWLMRGRLEYALAGPLLALAIVTPIMQVQRRRAKALAIAFLAVVAGQYSLMPFLMPALLRDRLARLPTRFDADGVCLQSTPYTCGPAASVTALRRLGITSSESELASLMHTGPTLGTPPDVLAEELEARFASQGLHCRYVAFDSINELPRNQPLLALMKHGFMVDHYVAVLEVNAAGVTVADPEKGKLSYSRDEFARRWRCVGIVLTRQS